MVECKPFELECDFFPAECRVLPCICLDMSFSVFCENGLHANIRSPLAVTKTVLPNVRIHVLQLFKYEAPTSSGSPDMADSMSTK